MCNVKLGEYVNISTGKLNANVANDKGKYPLFTCSKKPLKINNYSYDCECVLVAGNGDLNVKYYNGKFDAYQRTYIIQTKNSKVLNTKYLYYLINSNIEQLRKNSIGGVIKYIKLENLSNIEINLINIKEQLSIVNKLDKIEHIINIRKKQLEELEKSINAQFIKKFGILEINNKNWQIYNILDVAKIDTHMTNDFKKYAKLPHIGIENIEKDTGKIINYKSVAEANLTSGKYIFDERHIIYSKIRPNLNKVAIPNFKGLCSADAYPILTTEKCTKEYLAFVLRSSYFLNYILNYSTRTNIPKVNKEQLSRFNLPIPPIKLQNQFAEIVQKIDKQKLNLRDSLMQIENLKNSLIYKYFNQ